jgi:hypothetical protein
MRSAVVAKAGEKCESPAAVGSQGFRRCAVWDLAEAVTVDRDSISLTAASLCAATAFGKSRGGRTGAPRPQPPRKSNVYCQNFPLDHLLSRVNPVKHRSSSVARGEMAEESRPANPPTRVWGPPSKTVRRTLERPRSCNAGGPPLPAN